MTAISTTDQTRRQFRRILRPLAARLLRAVHAGIGIRAALSDYMLKDPDGAPLMSVGPDGVELLDSADAGRIIDDGTASPDGLQQVTLGEYVLLLNTLLMILDTVEQTDGILAALERLNDTPVTDPGA